jgi:hypothetical protein
MFILSGSPVEFFLMLALGAGGPFTDVASLLSPEAYFRSRNVELTIPNLLQRVSAVPKDGKAELQQLLAIRLLVVDPDEVRNNKEVRQVLQDVAAGKQGQDRFGFAKQYAGWALARLTGGKVPAPAATAAAVTDAFAWFPADVTWAAAVDLRPTAGTPPHDFGHLKTLFDRLLRPDGKEALFDFAEQVGNCRLDRMAFGVSMGPNPKDGPERVYVRLTGLADHQRLVAYLKAVNPGIRVEARKEAEGPVTVLSHANRSPAFVVIGDRELLIAGPADNAAAPGVAVDAVLDTRAGRRKGLPAGPLAGRLKQVSPACFALVVGDLPPDFPFLVAGLEGLKLTDYPRSVRLELLRDARGVELKLEGTMADAAAATRFTQEVTDAAETSLGKVKLLKDVLPAETVEQLRKMLIATRVESKGPAVRVGLVVPVGVLRVLPRLLPARPAGPGGEKQ